MYRQQRFAKSKLLFATHFQMSLNIYLLLVAIFFLQLELINEELTYRHKLIHQEHVVLQIKPPVTLAQGRTCLQRLVAMPDHASRHTSLTTIEKMQ